MSAKVDTTPHSTVVWCDRCPWFITAARDEADGHDTAVAHEVVAHPDLHAAEKNRTYFRRKQHALRG